MSRITLTSLMLTLVLFLGNSSGNYAAQSKQKPSDTPGGTLQKMIVENGSVTMDLDLNRLNGINSTSARPVALHFTVAANSFFSIVVFKDLLRGPEPGSMALIPQNPASGGLSAAGYSALPMSLTGSLKQLVIEKFLSSEAFDLAVRDSKSGFVFFNVEGDQYYYDANARLLSIKGGRLLISKEFANALGRPSDAGALVGNISLGASMQPVEIAQLDENGDVKSGRLPALNQPGVRDCPRPGCYHRQSARLGAIGQWFRRRPRGHFPGDRCL